MRWKETIYSISRDKCCMYPVTPQFIYICEHLSVLGYASLLDYVSVVETGCRGLSRKSTMHSTSMKCLIPHVCVILATIQCSSTTYPLEEDISHLTHIGPPKRWLVFMEIRVRRCIKLQTTRDLYFIDLMTYLRCLSFGHTLHTRCYRSLWPKPRVLKIRSVVSSSMILFSTKTTRDRYRSCHTRRQTYRLLVHKLFGFNLTLDEFTVFDTSYALPLPGQCSRATAKFIVLYNNGRIIYCGKRYPWSIYSNSNLATVKLNVTGRMEKYDIKLTMRFGVVDPFYSQNQQPSRTAGPSAWGSFDIATYHIAVEMIYRVRISVSHAFKQTHRFMFHDGPDAKMPRLPIYRKFDHQTLYSSSTFQVFYVVASKSTDYSSTLSYTADHSFAAQYISSNQTINLKNNTGCGKNGVESWMCAFRIVAPDHMYAQVHISSLNIYGIFANVYTSAGVALYNIVNNKMSLVGHWYYSITRTNGNNLTFTGSENQLVVSVYAYSPYSRLSCTFITYASTCIGSFIGKHIRPSMALLSQRVLYKKVTSMSSGRDSVHITYDVTNACHAIHISFLPSEYIVKVPFLHMYFRYEEIIKLTKETLGMRISPFPGLYTINVGGTYTKSVIDDQYSVNFPQGDGDIRGDIKYIDMDVIPIYGNIPVTLFNVYPTTCIQQCNSFIHVWGGPASNHLTCDICKYGWLGNSALSAAHEITPLASIQFQRVYGSYRIDISVQPVTESLIMCDKVRGIIYHSHGISLRFLSGYVFSAFTYGGDVWRFDKGDITDIHEHRRPGHCSFLTIPPRVRNWRMYMYIVASELEVHGSSWQRQEEHCAKYGANILTINDHQELYYIVQNIMLPFGILSTTIGVIPQVRLVATSTSVNHYNMLLCRVSWDNITTLRMYKMTWINHISWQDQRKCTAANEIHSIHNLLVDSILHCISEWREQHFYAWIPIKVYSMEHLYRRHQFYYLRYIFWSSTT